VISEENNDGKKKKTKRQSFFVNARGRGKLRLAGKATLKLSTDSYEKK